VRSVGERAARDQRDRGAVRRGQGGTREKGKLLDGEVMRVVRKMVGTNAEGGVRRKKK
jgi:hypothetical protein